MFSKVLLNFAIVSKNFQYLSFFLSLTTITGQRNFLGLGEGLLDKIFETKIGFQLSFTSNLKIWCF